MDLYCNSLDSDNFYTGQQGGQILLARPYPRFWQEVLLGDSGAQSGVEKGNVIEK